MTCHSIVHDTIQRLKGSIQLPRCPSPLQASYKAAGLRGTDFRHSETQFPGVTVFLLVHGVFLVPCCRGCIRVRLVWPARLLSGLKIWSEVNRGTLNGRGHARTLILPFSSGKSNSVDGQLSAEDASSRSCCRCNAGCLARIVARLQHTLFQLLHENEGACQLSNRASSSTRVDIVDNSWKSHDIPLTLKP